MTILATPEIWVFVSFVGFILLLLYFRVPGLIVSALDRRADTIRKELEEARRLRDEAQSLLAEYERKQRDAAKEAEEIVQTARAEAKAFAEETRQAMVETLERRTRLAEEKIGRAEAQALADVRAVAVDVAIAAAEKLIAEKLDPAADAKLVDESIAGLKGKLN